MFRYAGNAIIDVGISGQEQVTFFYCVQLVYVDAVTYHEIRTMAVLPGWENRYEKNGPKSTFGKFF
jgi:hypothetical protein